MKKKLTYFCLIFTILLVLSNRSFAQQDAHYSHYMFNGLVLNPAVAGSKESLSVFGLFRTQFVGIDGGPKTTTISAHMPIPAIRGGAGLHIVNDQIGFERNLSFLASYAYKKEMANGVLAAGASLGFMQRTLDGSKLKAADAGDPSIPSASVNAVAPDISLGLLYTTEQYYVGLSTTHVNRGKLNFDIPGTSDYRNVMHYYLTGGYTFNINSAFDVKPSAIIKYTKSLQFEANGMVYYNQKVWGGLSYRLNDAIIAMAGFNITDRIRLGYSYDYTISKLSQQSNGSHEVFLGYDMTFTKKIKTDVIIKTPRFL
jgi:type IX secretion system PorP/SprF family membrane protein